MANEPASSSAIRSERVPPYSEEAEKGVLGSILLDPERIVDICLEQQLVPDSFFVPAHKRIFEIAVEMSKNGEAIDILTIVERLRSAGQLDSVGGSVYIDRLVDSTPTAAHAEYYIDIVRQKHLLRAVIACSRDAENDCYSSEQSADLILSRVEQSFMDITERQHGFMVPWPETVRETMEHVEQMLVNKRGISGLSTGYRDIDRCTMGLRPGEMIVLAARPSMGKTSLAVNIMENIALAQNMPDRTPRPVGFFSLEMSRESLVLRMLCTHAEVPAFRLTGGYVPTGAHGRLTQAASALLKAPVYLDDTGGLDILELRARARRMWKKRKVQLIIVDYLQLLHSREYQRQGRQAETADISGNLKAMAKELRIPVLVLSQLNRAPEQADGKPKLADLRDSGAIEQDADVVCFLRRPCRIEGDAEHEDKTRAYLHVAKQRNGPTGEITLYFDETYTRFKDATHGVDGADQLDQFPEEAEAEAVGEP
jgi:replicative DNA helicase